MHNIFIGEKAGEYSAILNTEILTQIYEDITNKGTIREELTMTLAVFMKHKNKILKKTSFTNCVKKARLAVARALQEFRDHR